MLYSRTYDQYKRARNTAWHVLIDNRITTFPIRISRLLSNYDIQCTSPDRCADYLRANHITANREAIAIRMYGEPWILYNANAHRQRLYFSVAHELGHLLLDHTLQSDYNDYQDSEANVFARCLIMPAIVCHTERLLTADRIQSFFGVSHTAAAIRAERITELERRDKWLTSPLERRYAVMYDFARQGEETS